MSQDDSEAVYEGFRLRVVQRDNVCLTISVEPRYAEAVLPVIIGGPFLGLTLADWFGLWGFKPLW